MAEAESTAAQAHNQVLLEWVAPEFMPHVRGTKWFMGAGVITILLTLYALYTGSATFAIAIVLVAGVYYLTHNKMPRMITVQITQLGLRLDQKFIPYNQINAFWIVYDPGTVRALYLRLGGKNQRLKRVELFEQNPVEVRHLLVKEVPEVEGGDETFIDLLIRILRLQ